MRSPVFVAIALIAACSQEASTTPAPAPVEVPVGASPAIAVEKPSSPWAGALAYALDREPPGRAHTYGWGVPVDRPRGAQINQAACQAGDAEACWDLAQAHAAGLGVKRDEALAVATAYRACELGSLSACARGVTIAFGAVSSEQEHEMRRRAVAGWTSRCEAGDGASCGILATNYRRGGAQIAPDPARAAAMTARAIELLEVDCAAGLPQRCRDLAEEYRSAKQSDVLVASTFQRGVRRAWSDCDAGVMEACRWLALQLGTDRYGAPDDDGRARARTRVCELQWGAPCDDPRNHERGCQAGDPVACERAGRTDERDAIFRRWCDNGDDSACSSLM
jgi:hypothetical protein